MGYYISRTCQLRTREEEGGKAAHTIVNTIIRLAFAFENREVVLHPFELPLCSFVSHFIIVIVIFYNLVWEADLPRSRAACTLWVH
jgi:hypothetical protein